MRYIELIEAKIKYLEKKILRMERLLMPGNVRFDIEFIGEKYLIKAEKKGFSGGFEGWSIYMKNRTHEKYDTYVEANSFTEEKFVSNKEGIISFLKEMKKKEIQNYEVLHSDKNAISAQERWAREMWFYAESIA